MDACIDEQGRHLFPMFPFFLFSGLVSLTKLTLEDENVRGGEKSE